MEKSDFSESDFKGWRHSPMGLWFFDQYLQDYADASANVNGRMPGAGIDPDTLVLNAGVINGVEFTIDANPWEDE
jgi:hypothetical protein